MANVVLDYAVKFKQIDSLPSPSLGFLHKIGVAVPSTLTPMLITIDTASSAPESPAVIILTGDFLQGAVLNAFFSTSYQQTPFEAPFTVQGEGSAEAVAVAWASLINGIPMLEAVAVGNTIELMPNEGGLGVLVENATVDETNAKPLIEVSTKEELDKLAGAYAGELYGAFDGGLNRLTLIMITDIAELEDAIQDQESNFYTVHNSSAFETAGFMDATNTWSGVRAFSDIDEVVCASYSASKNTCAFLFQSTAKKAYKSLYAFGSLLSATFWRNQQYISVGDNFGAVTTVGEAESLFDDRVSFFLTDDEMGTRLGFFVAGGKSITTPYISKEIELIMQFEMTNYLTVNQPFNLLASRAKLEDLANVMIVDYIGLGYLDGEETNEIKITKSAEVFVVNGNLTTSPSVALWRVKIDSYQTQG